MIDRVSAWVRVFLVAATIVMVVGAFAALMGWEIPDKNRDAVMILLGALIARVEKIDTFFFGSSKASEDKNATIAAQAGAIAAQSGPDRSNDPILTGDS